MDMDAGITSSCGVVDLYGKLLRLPINGEFGALVDVERAATLSE